MMAAECGRWKVQLFELIFLGTAAAVPSAARGLPALLVGAGSNRFLVDCGEGTQRQLMRAGLGFRGLGHVLLTHAHLDQAASPVSPPPVHCIGWRTRSRSSAAAKPSPLSADGSQTRSARERKRAIDCEPSPPVLRSLS